jgi:hypothetical protein
MLTHTDASRTVRPFKSDYVKPFAALRLPHASPEVRPTGQATPVPPMPQ